MEKQIRNSSTAPSPITQPLKVIMAEPLQIVRFCKEDTGIQPQTKQAIRHHGDCIHKNLKCRNISHDAQVFFFYLSFVVYYIPFISFTVFSTLFLFLSPTLFRFTSPFTIHFPLSLYVFLSLNFSLSFSLSFVDQSVFLCICFYVSPFRFPIFYLFLY